MGGELAKAPQRARQADENLHRHEVPAPDGGAVAKIGTGDPESEHRKITESE
jgi:hypothetical protein